MSPIKVNDSSKDEKILCPSDSCSQLIDYENLIDLIQEQNIRDRYQRLDIECFCKTVFCFLCREQWHEPLSCDLYKNWIQKYVSHSVDPKSAQWQHKILSEMQIPYRKERRL